MDYDAVLAQVLALLQQEQRVAYRVLKRRLHLDDDVLEDLKDDLIYAKKLAVDEDGRVLVWAGGTSSAPTIALPVSPPATPEASLAQGEATLNHSTRDSDTRCLGHIDIACVRVLPVYECCVARFSHPSHA
jgi:hypothetical protein